MLILTLLVVFVLSAIAIVCLWEGGGPTVQKSVDRMVEKKTDWASNELEEMFVDVNTKQVRRYRCRHVRAGKQYIQQSERIT